VHVGQEVVLKGESENPPAVSGFSWQFEALGAVQTRSTAEPIVSWRPEGVGLVAVRLQVLGTAGVVATATRTLDVFNGAPIAAISGPRSGPRGSTWRFSAIGSVDPEGDALSYEWSVDGSAGAEFTGSNTSSIAAVVPGRTGAFHLVLRVTDQFGAQGVVERDALVRDGNAAPVAEVGSFFLMGPGETRALDGSRSSDPDGDDVFFQWKVEPSRIGHLDRLDAIAPNLTADAIGPGQATLVVSDGFLASDPAVLPFRVRNTPAPLPGCPDPAPRPAVSITREVRYVQSVAPLCGTWGFVAVGGTANQVRLFNVSDGSIADSWQLPSSPGNILLNADGTRLWVLLPLINTVAWIDVLGSTISTIPVNGSPIDLATASPDSILVLLEETRPAGLAIELLDPGGSAGRWNFDAAIGDSLAFDPDRGRGVVSDRGGYFQSFAIESGLIRQELWTTEPRGNGCPDVSLAPDGLSIIAPCLSSYDSSVLVAFDYDSHLAVRSFAVGAFNTGAGFLGSRLVSTGMPGILVFDAASSRLLSEEEPPGRCSSYPDPTLVGLDQTSAVAWSTLDCDPESGPDTLFLTPL